MAASAAKTAMRMGTSAAQQLGFGEMTADGLRGAPANAGPAIAKDRPCAERDPRHSVPLLVFSCIEPENCRISKSPRLLRIDDDSDCLGKNCGKSVNNRLTKGELRLPPRVLVTIS